MVECGQFMRFSVVRHRLRIFFAIMAGVFVVSFSLVAAAESSAKGSQPAPAEKAAERDSLMAEMRRLSHLVMVLSDSLGIEQKELIERASGEQALDLAFEDLADVVGGLTSELAQLDLKITDRTFSLRDASGGSIIEFEVPHDLGERLSEGIVGFSEALIAELPDDVSLEDLSRQWSSFYMPEESRRPRRVVHGDRVKVGDDIEVAEDEEIDGSVWACFGDANIYGRVDGDVLALGGNVFLDEGAEVTGQVIAVFGTLEQDKDAVIEGQVIVFDPVDSNHFWSMRSDDGLFGTGLMSFMFKQAAVLLVACCVLLALSLLPAGRRQSTCSMLRRRTVACFGYGLLVQVAVGILCAVLLLTIIGIPLGVLVIVALLVLTIVALVPVSIIVGGWFVTRLGSPTLPDWILCLVGLTMLHFVSFWSAVVSLLIGFSGAVTLFGGLGLAVKLLASCLGIGALVGSRFGGSVAVLEENTAGDNTQ